MDITNATIALEGLLEREDSLSEEVLSVVNDYLMNVWGIYSVPARTAIIQAAALNVGLLNAEDLE